MKRKIACLCILLLSFCHIVSAQSQTTDAFIKTYAEQYRQEKIYIHFDRSVYLPGDTVWYKAYLMADATPSNISKNFYADFISEDGKLLLHSVAPITVSSAYGQFVIPEDYKNKLFHIRAYTKWMLNFDSAFYYEKDISVIQQKNTSPANNNSSKVQVTVFPEGGNLVNGIASVVAFKATDRFGIPVSIEGIVTDGEATITDSLRSLHDGMGRFVMIPEAGKSYYFSWKDNTGNVGRTIIPTAAANGIVLKAIPYKGKTNFWIERTKDCPPELQKLTLIATMLRQQVSKASIDLTKQTATSGSLPTDQLNTGILQLTLFDTRGLPVAERIVFVNNHEYSVAATLTTPISDLNRRKKNQVEISLPDTLNFNLSVSVTDGGLQYDSSDNIYSHLLLSSEVKGYVYHPAYYFSNQSDSVRSHLDLVLLTNGWRRYQWEQIAQGKLPALTYPRETNYMQVTGRVILPGKSTLKPGEQLYLIIRSKDPKDTTKSWMLVPVNADGHFIVKDLLIYDTAAIYHKLLLDRKKSSVFFDNGLLTGPRSLHFSPDPEKAKYADSLLYAAASVSYNHKFDSMKTADLTPVTVNTKIKTHLQQVNDEYTSALFRGTQNSPYMFDVQEDPGSKGVQNISRYIDQRIPGLATGGPGPGYYYRPRIDMRTGTYSASGLVSIYVNELEIDYQELQSILLSDVAYIKFYRSGSLAYTDEHAALFVYTRHGDGPDSSKLAHGLVSGYTWAKEFYSPDYSKSNPGVPDTRITLYWNPFIQTDAEHRKIKLDFYNNDTSKSMRIVLEGVAEDGRLIHVEKVIE